MRNAAFLALAARGLDNGLFWNSPPMGWRSWNCYGADVNQSLMEAVMSTVARPYRNGRSLASFGYRDVGLDDAWQKCGAGVHGGFHDSDGNPIVDVRRFPDMKAMVDHAHALGLTAGWYGNNCICRELRLRKMAEAVYEGDVRATLNFGFDGIKFDFCGEFLDLDKYAGLFNRSGQRVAIENCHWGYTVPSFDRSGTKHCPYHFFRTSVDIKNTWRSVMHNLASTTKFSDKDRPLAGQGCWAYPDMLEVGRMKDAVEDRSHFGAWVITSSPLILGFDVQDSATFARVWDVVTNELAIKINQEWAGHPGFLLKKTDYVPKMDNAEQDEEGVRWSNIKVFLKPQRRAMAVFVLNDGRGEENVAISFADLRWRDLAVPTSGRVEVTSIWDGKVRYEEGGFETGAISAHDSRLYLVSASAVLYV
jgi:alpha-galactosidase